MPRPRHLLLNALFLDPSVSGGPETYLRGLAPALAKAAPEMRVSVATTGRGARSLAADGWSNWAGLHTLRCEDGQRLRRTVAEQVALPVLARRLGVDLLHSLASVAPLHAGVPSAITLHDVTFLRRPTFGRMTTFGMRQVISRAAPRAGSLITASAAARDEICSLLPLDPADFTVVPHGAGRPPAAQLPVAAALRSRHGLEHACLVLCVAAKRPHKNQELLLRALPLLAPDAVVALAGHSEPYQEKLRALACDLGVAERVRFIEYLPDAELEGLWSMARCAAFPTLAEGFGLPVLEAMARGVPVACSDLPVLREVGGEVPHYFPPHDPLAAAAAIEAAWRDAGAGAAGRQRAARFSWEAAAEGTLYAYERALAAEAR